MDRIAELQEKLFRHMAAGVAGAVLAQIFDIMTEHVVANEKGIMELADRTTACIADVWERISAGEGACREHEAAIGRLERRVEGLAELYAAIDGSHSRLMVKVGELERRMDSVSNLKKGTT